MPKSKKVLKRVADLPSWFDLSNYEESSDLDLSGWLHELQRRWLMKYQISLAKETKLIRDDLSFYLDLPQPPSGEKLDLRPIFAALFAKPINNDSLRGLILKHSEDLRHVQFLSVGHTFELADLVRESVEGDPFKQAWSKLDQRKLSSDEREQATKLIDTPVNEVARAAESRHSKWLRTISGRYDQISVTIDITAPYKVLVEDFKVWLTLAREQLSMSPPPRKFTRRHFKKWSDYQILPYLDLNIWSNQEGVTITNNLMGEAIFPHEDEVDTTEKVRQTIAPLAEKLVSTEIIYSLAAQEQAEKLENETKSA